MPEFKRFHDVLTENKNPLRFSPDLKGVLEHVDAIHPANPKRDFTDVRVKAIKTFLGGLGVRRAVAEKALEEHWGFHPDKLEEELKKLNAPALVKPEEESLFSLEDFTSASEIMAVEPNSMCGVPVNLYPFGYGITGTPTSYLLSFSGF